MRAQTHICSRKKFKGQYLKRKSSPSPASITVINEIEYVLSLDRMCSLATEKNLFAVAGINHRRVVALQTAFHQQPQSIVVIHLYVCVSGGVGCIVREHILSSGCIVREHVLSVLLSI
jgi:hypothetical protein